MPIFQFLPNSAVSDTQRLKFDISTTIFGIYCTFTDKRGKNRKKLYSPWHRVYKSEKKAANGSKIR